MENQTELVKTTIECLEKTFKVTDKTERQEAEKKLKSLESNIYEHCKNILFIIKENTLIPNDIKLSVIIYLKNMIKKKIDNNSLPNEAALEIIKFYSEYILTSDIPKLCLENVSVTVQQILNYQVIVQDPNLAKQLVLHFVGESKKSPNLQAMKGILCMFENVCTSKSTNRDNILEVLPPILEVLHTTLLGVIESFKTINIKQNAQNFMIYNDLCKEVFNILFNITLKLKKLSLMHKLIDVFIAQFASIGLQIATSPIPEISPEYFIVWSESGEFDSCVNSMKGKCFQFINCLLNFYKNKITDENLAKQCTVIVEQCIKNLTYVISNKFDYLSEMEKDGEVNDNNYEFLIYQVLLFFSRFLIKEPIMSQFTSYIKNFVINIIFPLLISTKVEIRNMDEDGENYNTFIDDVINDQKNKNIKSICATLLEKISEIYDGVGTFAVSYCVQLIEFSINGKKFDTISNYNLLVECPNEWLLTNIRDELLIETSLLNFSILVNLMHKNSVLLDAVKKLINNYLPSLLSANSFLIKSRLTIFLGIYIDHIFESEDKNFQICIEFLFRNILAYKENQGVSFQASDSLNDIFSVEKFTLSLRDVIKTFMPQMIENIIFIDFGLYFDVIYEIVSHIDIGEFVISLSKQLVQRIQNEVIPKVRIKTKGQKDTEYSTIVNKCFNILRNITDKKQYILQFQNDFEIIFKELFDYMKKPTKIDFDEDIVMMMTSMIKHLEAVPPCAINVIQYLNKFLKKSKGLMLDLFELMNQLLLYGTDEIIKHDQINHILSIFTLSISTSVNSDSSSDKSPFLGAVLMQMWLITSNKIPEDSVKLIIIEAIKCIKDIFDIYQTITEFEDEPDLYVIIGMITLIYAGFVHYPISTFECLIVNNDLQNFFDWTSSIKDVKYFNVYQTKIMIVGISSILKRPEVMKDMPKDHTYKLLTFAHNFLTKQKMEESRGLKKRLKKQIDCNFVSSESEDEEESEDENVNVNMNHLNKFMNQVNSNDMKQFYENYKVPNHKIDENGEKEIKEICSRIICEIKTVDEYDFFKNSIEVFHNTNAELFNEWMATLNEKEKSVLETLIHTRRVIIEKNNFKTTVPRKIMTIKRNKPNNP